MRALVLILLAIATAGAQTTGRIEGRVVTPQGTPVPKATVRLQAATAQQGSQPVTYVEVTASDGSFSVQSVSSGTYAPNASRQGFTALPNVRPSPVIVTAGSTAKVELQLAQLASISGIVTDEDGDPVPSAQVRVMRYAYQLGSMRLSSMSASGTDDQGHFRIANVQPGRYYLSVSSNSQANFSAPNEIRGASAQQMNLPTFYPSSLDTRGATLVDVQYASIENLRLRMRRGQTFRIRGTLSGITTTQTGQRPGLTIFSKSDVTNAAGVVTSRADGQFEVNAVPQGEYTITARLMDPANPGKPAAFGRADVRVTSGDIDGVNLRLSPASELTGRVRLEGGDLATFFAGPGRAAPTRAVATGAVIGPNPATNPAARPPAAINFQLMPTEISVGGQAQVAVSPDGTFKTEVIPSTYLVNFNVPGTYVKQLRLNSQDVTGRPLDLSSGGDLEIVLSNKPAQVRLSPAASAPPPGDRAGYNPNTVVSLWPVVPNTSSQNGGVQVGFLIAQGNLTLQLPPGDYYAVLWEEVPSQELIRIPDFLQRFNTIAKRVTLNEGAAATVEPAYVTKSAAEKIAAEFP